MAQTWHGAVKSSQQPCTCDLRKHCHPFKTTLHLNVQSSAEPIADRSSRIHHSGNLVRVSTISPHMIIMFYVHNHLTVPICYTFKPTPNSTLQPFITDSTPIRHKLITNSSPTRHQPITNASPIRQQYNTPHHIWYHIWILSVLVLGMYPWYVPFWNWRHLMPYTLFPPFKRDCVSMWLTFDWPLDT